MALDALNTKINALRDEATAVRRDFSTEINALNANTSLSPSGKREYLDKIEPGMRAKLANLDADETRALEHARETLQRTVMGSAAEGDVIAFRDAHDRAGRIDSEREARDEMTRALDVGDAALAKAILHASIGKGWSSAVDRYTVKHPDMKTTITDLIAVHRWTDSTEVAIERTLAYQLPDARLTSGSGHGRVAAGRTR